MQTDGGRNRRITTCAKDSLFSFVYAFLYRIDDAVSPGVGRILFLSLFHSAVLRENEIDGEAKPFCCCFIHILCAPPSCQLWYLPAVSQNSSLITRALCQPCVCKLTCFLVTVSTRQAQRGRSLRWQHCKIVRNRKNGWFHIEVDKSKFFIAKITDSPAQMTAGSSRFLIARSLLLSLWVSWKPCLLLNHN